MYRKVTTESYKEAIKKRYNGLYELLDKYQGSFVELRFNCLKHGIFKRTPKQMNNNVTCPLCTKEREEARYKAMTKTTEQFIKEAMEVHKGRFIYDENTVYVNNETDIIITCPIHGQFKQKPAYHLRGGGCKKCNFKVTSTETFIEEANKVHKGKYIYTKSIYVDSKTPICIICPKHGEFWQIPTEHIRGYGCQKCHQSKLECTVKEFLTNNNMAFEEQTHKFGLGYQSLDFYLLDYNIAIECQGIQHFKNHPFFFKDENSFLTALERDIHKFNKCKEQGVRILYFTKKEWLLEDIYVNPLFQGIYNKDDVFTDLNELFKQIKVD